MPSRLPKNRCRRLAAALSATVGALSLGALSVAPAGASAAPDHSDQALQVAYLSFAVQNSYDAPMLAAARAQAKLSNVDLTVFDADNSTTKQYSELQDAITSHKYKGIIVQPIFGTGLLSLVRQAIAAHIAVANLDQELGPNLATDAPQVKGLAANVVFVPTVIGTKLGNLVVKACSKYNPCNVGYMYDIKASALDVALHGAFMKVVSAHSNIKMVAEGQSYFTPSDGLTATQDMLTAHPDLTLIVGSDQGIEGAQQAVAAAGKTGKVVLVGYGASAAALKGIRSGAWYGDVAQLPATEGRLVVKYIAESIRTGKLFGGVDPVAELPHGGVVTKADVSEFHAEWPG